MPQRPGLSRHQQPPLPLIQMREDHRELRRQDLRCFLFTVHTTAACRIPGSYGLFFCKLLELQPVPINRIEVGHAGIDDWTQLLRDNNLLILVRHE